MVDFIQVSYGAGYVALPGRGKSAGAGAKGRGGEVLHRGPVVLEKGRRRVIA